MGINKVRNCEQYYPEKDGHSLGLATSRSEALFMLETGYVSCTDTVNNLSLWAVWHDAVSAGEIPLEDAEGEQFLGLSDDVIICVKETNSGPEVKLISEAELWDRYRNETWPNVLNLKHTANPIRLR